MKATLCAAILLSLTLPIRRVDAGVYGKWTFHALDRVSSSHRPTKRSKARAKKPQKTLRQRLSTRARLNVSAVGAIFRNTYAAEGNRGAYGTATLIHRDYANHRGIVLTNEHVMRGIEELKGDDRGVGTKMLFPTLGLVNVTKTLLSSRKLDYAFVEIELPDIYLVPAKLAPFEKITASEVYSTGFDGLRTAANLAEPAAQFPQAASARVKRMVQSGGLPQLIASGKVLSVEGQFLTALRQTKPNGSSGKLRGHRLMTDIPAFPGGSGSPVFWSSSHTLMGLRTSVPGDNQGRVVSLGPQETATKRQTIETINKSATSVVSLAHIWENAQDQLLRMPNPPESLRTLLSAY